MAKHKTNKTDLLKCLAPLIVAFPEWAKSLTDAEKTKTFELYCQMLNDIPISVIQESVLAHIREGKYFPKIAEIREYAAGILRRRKDNPPDDLLLNAPPPSEEEKLHVKKLIAELAEKLSAKNSGERGH